MGAGVVGAMGAGTRGGQVRRLPARPVQARPKVPYVLETPAGCLPRETGTLRTDHHDAAWRTFRSG